MEILKLFDYLVVTALHQTNKKSANLVQNDDFKCKILTLGAEKTMDS